MRHHHKRFLQASLVSGFFLLALLIYFTGLFSQPKKMFESLWLPSVEPMASFGKVTDFFAGVQVVNGDSIEVKEVIDVDFSSPQAEFVRVVPFKYQSNGGNFKLGIRKVQAALNNGAAVTDIKRDNGNFYVSVKRQDGSNFVGVNKISLNYQVTRTINYLADNDQLVYMVTGYNWPVEIERSRAVIALPETAGESQLAANCYIGQPGRLSDNCQVSSVKTDSVGFDSLTSLKPGEGMIVSFIWPKGLLTPPTVLKQFWWIVRDNPILLLPFIALLLLYINWLSLAKEKWWQKTSSSSVPPTSLLPVELGTIYDNQVNTDDLLLIILDAARRGYLIIRREEDYWLINKVKDWSKLELVEKKFLDIMFAEKDFWRSDDAACRRSLHDAMHIGKRDVYELLTDKGFFKVSPHTTRMTYLVIAMIFWVGGAVFVPWYGGGFAAAAIFVTGIIIFWFGYYMPHKSPLGLAALRDAFSYKQYFKSEFKEISTADWVNHLPYILLFHVDKWAMKALKNKEIKELSWFIFPHKKAFTIKVLLKALRRWEREM